MQVQASECKKRARKICCEELVRYASRNSFSHPYQIGWIDVPQKQKMCIRDRGAIDKMNELIRQNPSYVTLGQFDNPDNPQTHYETTGAEILRQQPNVEVFVAGIGTGGTFSLSLIHI